MQANDPKIKLVAAGVIGAIVAVAAALGKGDLSQSLAVLGSALLVGLGVNGAGHGMGQALAGLAQALNSDSAPAKAAENPKP